MVRDLLGHVVGLSYQIVQLVLVRLFVIKVHYSIPAIVPVNFFSMVDSLDGVEIL